jgi:hypothetical protein
MSSLLDKFSSRGIEILLMDEFIRCEVCIFACAQHFFHIVWTGDPLEAPAWVRDPNKYLYAVCHICYQFFKTTGSWKHDMYQPITRDEYSVWKVMTS